LHAKRLLRIVHSCTDRQRRSNDIHSPNLRAGTLDKNDNGMFTGNPFTATFTGPDANGRGTIASSLNTTYAYYFVRPGVIHLIENDLLSVVGGTAYGQGTATSFSNSSLAGRFVFNKVGSSISGSFASAGQFATDGNGKFTGGIADANDKGTVTSGSLGASTVCLQQQSAGNDHHSRRAGVQKWHEPVCLSGRPKSQSARCEQ
jgi:hypothetical protein